MQPWKPMLLIVPAGLLLGIAAGQAMRPVPLMKEERPWPQSVRESAREIEPWRPIYHSGPQDLTPAAYSYRPDLDYDAFAWPDQTDRSAELLAAEYDYDGGQSTREARYARAPEPDLPLARRASSEIAASRAMEPGAEAGGIAEDGLVAVETASPPGRPEIVTLPPVPPPLEQAAAPAASASVVE